MHSVGVCAEILYPRHFSDNGHARFPGSPDKTQLTAFEARGDRNSDGTGRSFVRILPLRLRSNKRHRHNKSATWVRARNLIRVMIFPPRSKRCAQRRC
jgi:hypothetical protein